MKTSRIFRKSSQSAFTIIELLVVIVIIGILATITIVAYNGIAQKATIASLQSDLSGASSQLKLYQVDNGAYPNSISDCPSPLKGNLCLKASSGSTYSSYSANNSTNPQTFSLSAISGGQVYIVTNNSAPIAESSAPFSPVADWLATTQGDHYGNYFDLVSKQYATIIRNTPKTIYDPSTARIYDVPANYLGINPRGDGKSGSEAVIEEPRTNYLLNSYFSVDSNSDGLSDNWTAPASNSTNTLTRNTTNSIYGTVQRINAVHTNGTGAGSPSLLQSSAASSFVLGDSAAVSIWYRNLSKVGAGVTLILNARDSGGTSLGQVSTTLTQSSDGIWRYATVTYASLPASTSKCSLSISQAQTNDGDMYDIEIAAVQLEKGTFATSYIPTIAATATRNADYAKVPATNWNVNDATYFAVIGPSPTYPASYAYVLMNYQDASNDFRLARDTYSSDGQPHLSTIGSGTAKTASGPTASGSYMTIAGKYTSGGNSQTYFNGNPGTATPGIVAPSGLAAFTYIGSNTTSIPSYNGPIQRIVAYPSALSDANVMSVTSAIKDGP
jgi:prepilin-type N-terminal cleavage/methylation domain-containing protein